MPSKEEGTVYTAKHTDDDLAVYLKIRIVVANTTRLIFATSLSISSHLEDGTDRFRRCIMHVSEELNRELAVSFDGKYKVQYLAHMSCNLFGNILNLLEDKGVKLFGIP